MCLADGGIVFVWVAGVLLIGLVGFFVVILGLAARFIRRLFSMILGHHGPPSQDAVSRPGAQSPCRNLRCGYLNPAGARYCARCGSRLDGVADVNSYG